MEAELYRHGPAAYLPQDPNPPVPAAGVVWLESLDPEDGAAGVLADRMVAATLRCLAQLDPDLIAISVNGTACTVANGRLTVRPLSLNPSLGVFTPDYRQVEAVALARWYDAQGETVPVVVSYHGETVATSSLVPLAPEDRCAAADGEMWTWATDPNDRSGASADLELEVVELYYGGCRDVQLTVTELTRRVAAAAELLVGHHYVGRFLASGVVGVCEIVRCLGSGYVEGWRLDRPVASGVVQGWKVVRVLGSGTVGVRFLWRGLASGVVGVEQLSRLVGSGVVFGERRGNVLEVHVQDASTYAALTAAGVTWS